MGHFWAAFYLCFKTTSRVELLDFDWHENEHEGGNIFIRTVSHEGSFWHRGKTRLGIGLSDHSGAPRWLSLIENEGE